MSKKNPKIDGAVGVVVEGNPDDPNEKPSVMDLVEATLSPHLRAAAAQQKPKRAEDEADHPVLRKRPPAKLKPMEVAMGQRTRSQALSGSF